MTPNPLYFLVISSTRKHVLGVLSTTFRATPDGREPLQPQTRGEALSGFVGAFAMQRSA